MRISKIKVKNYKGFLESDWAELAEDFTLVVGPNNAGKTAFLEAISLGLLNVPHHTVARPPADASSVEADIVATHAEVRKAQEGESLAVPLVGPGLASVNGQNVHVSNDRRDQDQQLTRILQSDPLTFRLCFGPSAVTVPALPSFARYQLVAHANGHGHFAATHVVFPQDRVQLMSNNVAVNSANEIGVRIGQWARTQTFLIQATRTVYGQ